ncbi:MAG: flagellar FliJ family protein [Acetobacteraceae bacterium]|nr:flagellar FliJ family protein [Acetobacteraceae bacterium]
MRRFRFRLDRVLRVREVRERLGQARLAAAVGVELGELGRLHSLRQRLHAAGARLEARLASDARVGEVGARLAQIHRLGRDQAEQEGRLEQARRASQLRRTELVELWKAREILERLRRRRLEQHRMECLREDQVFLDEVGAARSGGARSARGGEV